MKRIAATMIAMLLLVLTGFISYRAGIRKRVSWGEPYTVNIGGGESAIDADRLVVHLENEKRITIDLRRRPFDMISVFAGDLPANTDSKSYSSLVVRPGACNVIHLSVETHEKSEHSTSPST